MLPWHLVHTTSYFLLAFPLICFNVCACACRCQPAFSATHPHIHLRLFHAHLEHEFFYSAGRPPGTSLQKGKEQGAFTAPTPRDRGTTGPSRKRHLCISQTCGNPPPTRSIGQEMKITMGTRPAATAAMGIVPLGAERDTRPSKFRFAGGVGGRCLKRSY